MLERYLDALLFEMQDANEFLMALPIEDRASWEGLPAERRARLKDKADGWLETPVPELTASAFISFSRIGLAADYIRNYRLRREMLRDLVVGSCVVPDGRYDLKLADVIWAICEESSWILPNHNPAVLGQNGLPLPDPYGHRIDSAAAETAADLALTVQMIASRLDSVTPQLTERIERECVRRIIQPFSSLADTAWLCGPRGESLRCLSGCTMTFLTLDRDNRRRWTCMRKAWTLFDRLLASMPADGSITGGLEDWEATVEPVMDMAMMVLSVSRERVDVRAEKQLRLLCHYPVFCHIGQNMFINPGSHSMRPSLCGALIYRMGDYAGDEALCDLGVFLDHTCGETENAGQTLFHYAADLFNREAMDSEPARPPFRSQGYYAARQVMVARRAEDSERGLALAAHGGVNGALGAHADAGDFVLFCEGEPVLADAGFIGSTAWHNLPTIANTEQRLGASFGARDVSCRLEDGYAMLSMDLGAAYPAQAGIYSWQRTLIYERENNIVQLMEVFDLKTPSEVHFNFVTPFEPELGNGFAQLGPVRMRWEPGLSAVCEAIDVPEGGERALWGEKLYRVVLTPNEPIENGQMTFVFNALRTFG